MMLSKLLSGSKPSALVWAASMVAGQRQLAAFKELVGEPGTQKSGAAGDDDSHGGPDSIFRKDVGSGGDARLPGRHGNDKQPYPTAAPLQRRYMPL